MKKENAILAGLGIAIAGFFGYRYYKKKQQQKKTAVAEPEDQFIEFDVNFTKGGYTPYQKKVMDLQAWLGVAVDGIAGPQTNGALQKKLPNTFSNLGPVSNSNIDKYIALKNGPANLWL